MTGMTPREVRRCRHVASVHDMFVYHIHKISGKLAIDGEFSIGRNVVTQMSYMYKLFAIIKIEWMNTSLYSSGWGISMYCMYLYSRYVCVHV